jgi:hypothetical protein
MFITVFHKLTPEYRVAVTSSLVQQGITGFLVLGMDVCGGDMGQMWLACFVAYWVGFLLVHKRRQSVPTRIDVMLIRFGFIPLLIIGYALFYFIWKARGYSV